MKDTLVGKMLCKKTLRSIADKSQAIPDPVDSYIRRGGRRRDHVFCALSVLAANGDMGYIELKLTIAAVWEVVRKLRGDAPYSKHSAANFISYYRGGKIFVARGEPFISIARKAAKEHSWFRWMAEEAPDDDTQSDDGAQSDDAQSDEFADLREPDPPRLRKRRRDDVADDVADDPPRPAPPLRTPAEDEESTADWQKISDDLHNRMNGNAQTVYTRMNANTQMLQTCLAANAQTLQTIRPCITTAEIELRTHITASAAMLEDVVQSLHKYSAAADKALSQRVDALTEAMRSVARSVVDVRARIDRVGDAAAHSDELARLRAEVAELREGNRSAPTMRWDGQHWVAH